MNLRSGWVLVAALTSSGCAPRQHAGLATLPSHDPGTPRAVVAEHAAPARQEIAWVDDYAAARSLATQTHKPLLVYFEADWCAGCHELDLHAFGAPEVISESQRFVAVRLDLSAGSDVAPDSPVLSSYHAEGVPLIVLHAADGHEADRVSEPIAPNALLERMRAVR